jgi:putative ABC transport system substrate-binding protein
LAAFRQGLHDTGFIGGENVLIEYRWAGGQYNRLSELASDLVRRHVSELDGRVSADGDKMTNELVSDL